jgi:hypothetical protein
MVQVEQSLATDDTCHVIGEEEMHMNTRTATTIVLTIALLIGGACNAAAAVITNLPSGDGLWSTPGNWIDGVAPANGDSVVLMVNNGYAPTTVDIANLALDYLVFSNDSSGITLSGNDFTFNTILCLHKTAPFVTNTIKQDVAMTRMAPSVVAPIFAIAGYSALKFDGVLGATSPAIGLYYSWNWSGSPDGRTLLMNTNTFAGGVPFLYNRLTFYRDANLGLVPPTSVPDYIRYVNGAKVAAGTTGGFNKAVIHPNRGLRVSGQSWLFADDNVKLVHKGTISDGGGTLTFFEQAPVANGIITLSGSNSFSGTTTIAGDGKNNVLVLDNDFAFGSTYSANTLTVASALDLNGYGLTTLRPSVYNNSGYYGCGVLRNNSLSRTASVTTDCILGGGSAVLLGGRGNITLLGSILGHPSFSGPLVKAGTGTATLKGTSGFTNDTSVRAGTFVCDYTLANTPRLSGTNRMLAVRGATVNFIGNDSSPTTEEILDWQGNQAGVPQGAAALRITTGSNQDFTLSARRLIVSLGDSLDISLVNTGSGIAAFTNALSAINNGTVNDGGALGGNVTFGKSTWAQLVAGSVAGLPDVSFETSFVTSTSSSHVDIAGATSISNASAQTLRAKDPGATTLTIAAGQTLALGLNDGTRIPGILLTPASGSVDINGGIVDIGVNNWLHLHNYSANRLTIGSFIKLNVVNSRMMTCGPGEVKLTCVSNTFSDLGVYGGTMLFDQIADAGQAQELGAGQLYLGDATLKYTGAGHSSDRTIVLRGSGAIDASGSGPLAFTTSGNVIANPGSSFSDMPLTLTGTGTGSIAGTMAMPGGYLTKSGSGLWTLGSGYTNWETTVKAGTLCVNGTLHSWNLVNVEPGGRLAGNAVIPREVAISGSVAPGLSAGTLKTGFVTLNPGAIYEWEIGNPGTSDVIAATGDIDIGTAENSITVMVAKVAGTGQSGEYPLLRGTIVGASNAIFMSYASGLVGPEHPIIDGGTVKAQVVPEPAALLMAAGLLFAVRRAARRG